METNGLNDSVLEEQFNKEVETTVLTPDEDKQKVLIEDDNKAETIDFDDENAALDSSSEDLDLGEYNDDIDDAEEVNDDVTSMLHGKTKEQIVAILEDVINKKHISSVRKDIDAIKIAYYKLHRLDTETLRKEFYETHSSDEPFIIDVDPTEVRLKELFNEYRLKRDLHIQNIESQKEKNYTVKLQIIEELKELLNGNETLNHTFNAFRDLQNRWKESGSIPKQHIKDLWETYHLYVENFYDFIKINKELRDLDLKKNYEAKLTLCEDAEELLLEPNVTTAFKKLQRLHELWREVGPVSIEHKEELWDRFKNTSTQINKRHQDHFELIKDDQRKNLEMKTALCEKAEVLGESVESSRKAWDKASEDLIEIQKLWKTIGFAPKKDNTKIYERFRMACDKFFEKKRDFFVDMKESMENNLQNKIALCIRAEAISEDNEWKAGTEELVLLQKQWKEIGSVPRKQSDLVWNRFRAACDKFFTRKSEYYSNLDDKYTENLNKKKDIIKELQELDIKKEDNGFDILKSFQRRWSEIGFVPVKFKDSIQKEYRTLIDNHFNTLRSDDNGRKIDHFKEKVGRMRSDGNDRKLHNERERLCTKVKQLETDITLWENNIGFFSNSKNAQAVINDVNIKISKAKKEIVVIMDKIKMIDAEQ